MGNIFSEIFIKPGTDKAGLLERVKAALSKKNRIGDLILNLYEFASPYELPPTPNVDWSMANWGTRFVPVVKKYMIEDDYVNINCETPNSPPATALGYVAKDFPESEITLRFKQSQSYAAGYTGEARFGRNGVTILEGGKVKRQYNSIDEFIEDSINKEGMIFESTRKK